MPKTHKRKTLYVNTDAGNVEQGIKFFNKVSSAYTGDAAEAGGTSGEASGEGTGLGESKRFKKLTRSLWGDPSGRIKTFAIISPENPKGALGNEDDPEYVKKFMLWTTNPKYYNKLSSDKMSKELLAKQVKTTGDAAMGYGHFTWIPLRGNYGGYENSRMILNLTYSDAETLARSYGQESFFFGNVFPDHSDIAYYLTTNGCKTYRKVDSCSKVSVVSEAENFFSKFGCKFQIDMPVFSEEVPEANECFMSRTLEERRGFVSRGQYRREIKQMRHLCETSTSRVLQHIVGDEDWAIVSPYRSEYSEDENRKRMQKLQQQVRSMGYGFIQFISRWVEDGIGYDERSLFIPKARKSDAIKLGKEYEQSSVIVKEGNACYEICTNPFETYQEGDIVRTYNLSGDKVLNIADAEKIFAKRKGGPASKPIKGNARPFHLSEVVEVEPPRPSYFQQRETYRRVWWRDPLEEDTVKQGSKWVNKGKAGTHGTFKTKKAADAQRKAMFANSKGKRNFGETLKRDYTGNNVLLWYDWMEEGDGYPVAERDIRKFIIDLLDKGAMKGSEYGDIEGYVEDNFDDLYDEYEWEILDRWEDGAKEWYNDSWSEDGLD